SDLAGGATPPVWAWFGGCPTSMPHTGVSTQPAPNCRQSGPCLLRGQSRSPVRCSDQARCGARSALRCLHGGLYAIEQFLILTRARAIQSCAEYGNNFQHVLRQIFLE